MEVIMATTVARRITAGREDFWIRIVIAFILFGFLLCWFSFVFVSCELELFTAIQVRAETRNHPHEALEERPHLG